MFQDPLSEVLALVGARSAVAGGFIAGGRWAIRFPPPARMKFFVAARGECWLKIDGEASPVHLREGDVFLLVAARSFLVASHRDARPLDARPLDALVLFADRSPVLRHIGEGEDFVFLGGHVLFDSEHVPLLIESLPPFVHVPATSTEAGTLTWLIRQLVDEHRTARPGASFASAQLAQLMFLQILRAFVADAELSHGTLASRLRLITDRRLSPALRSMHADPARAWQLDELAKLAGMSRTAFAVYFKSVAGVAPLAYLTEWRMRLAERELRRSDATFAELALTLGYASESAFSTAFKRVMGTSPKHYRRRARSRFAPPPEAAPLPDAVTTLHA